jgi:hypothetical protein
MEVRMGSKRVWMERSGWAYVVAGAVFVVLAFVPSWLDALDRLAMPGADPATPITRLYTAIAGALTAGMGVMVALSARWLDRGPAAIARALAAGVLTWFVLDSGASLALGSWQNAVGNVGFLLLGLPSALLARSEVAPRLDGSRATAAG